MPIVELALCEKTVILIFAWLNLHSIPPQIVDQRNVSRHINDGGIKPASAGRTTGMLQDGGRFGLSTCLLFRGLKRSNLKRITRKNQAV